MGETHLRKQMKCSQQNEFLSKRSLAAFESWESGLQLGMWSHSPFLAASLGPIRGVPGRTPLVSFSRCMQEKKMKLFITFNKPWRSLKSCFKDVFLFLMEINLGSLEAGTSRAFILKQICDPSLITFWLSFLKGHGYAQCFEEHWWEKNKKIFERNILECSGMSFLLKKNGSQGAKWAEQIL